ncbi:hypothetical protein M0802_011639 [Mischocyttarus mexicanus]|nr:hypothetical protein M0802_011639 [Mischocyttarus mexicanus]
MRDKGPEENLRRGNQRSRLLVGFTVVSINNTLAVTTTTTTTITTMSSYRIDRFGSALLLLDVEEEEEEEEDFSDINAAPSFPDRHLRDPDK